MLRAKMNNVKEIKLKIPNNNKTKVDLLVAG